jgi:alpha-1,2-mannosyltransferase
MAPATMLVWVETVLSDRASARPARGWLQRPRIRAAGTAPRMVFEAVCFVVLPLIGPAMIVAYLIGAYRPRPGVVDGIYFRDGGFLFDLHVMWQAGHDVATLHSPYPFVYPAPAALEMVPFGALPWSAAVVAFTLASIAAIVLALRALNVRDWRCYAVTLGAMPMVSSIMIGTLSTFIALAAALAWRYRERRWIVAGALAAAIASKILLWPLVIWLLATRRFRAAATTIVCTAAATLGAWALFGFDGLREYPHRLSRVAGLEQDKSYSPFALFRALGLSMGSSRLALLALTAALVVAIVVAARRHDGDRRSFAVAVVASLALTPIVWLHYLVLLVVPVALYRQRFSAAWAIPLLFWLLPGQENNGQIANILIAFGLAGATLALASRRRSEPAPVPVLSTP